MKFKIILRIFRHFNLNQFWLNVLFYLLMYPKNCRNSLLRRWFFGRTKRQRTGWNYRVFWEKDMCRSLTKERRDSSSGPYLIRS